MNQIAVVACSTGLQGRSVVKALSEEGYRVRALTRDPFSPKAEHAFAGLKNVTAWKFDINDIDSVRNALDGATVLFAMSVSDMELANSVPGAVAPSPTSGLDEFEQGVRFAEVAKEMGVEVLIWSTAPDNVKISKGRYEHMFHQYRFKHDVEHWLIDNKIRSFSIIPASFMENCHASDSYEMLKDNQDGTLTLIVHRANLTKPSYPLFYVEADLGRLVVTLIKNFESVENKSIKAFAKVYSLPEMVKILEHETGKVVKVETKSPSVVPGSDFDHMYEYFADERCTYFGRGDDPDEHLKRIGFEFTPFEQYVREKIVPSLLYKA